jgi:hypothetical protein
MGRKNGVRGDNFKGDDSDRHPGGGIGAQSKFTEELGERIINALWTGECKSLVEVGKQEWAPTRRTIQLWKNKYPEFGAALEEAQIALGDLYVQKNQEIITSMLAGTIEPSAANVAVRFNQWVAQSLDPRQYANKSYVDKNENKTVTHVFSNRIPVEDLSEDELDALEGALVKSKLLITGPTQN